MNCRQCGARIPDALLEADSFRCPECGRLYRRKNAQVVVNSEVKKPVVRKEAKKKLSLLEKLKTALTQKTLKLPVWFCIIAAICLISPVFGGGDDEVAPANLKDPEMVTATTTVFSEEALPIVEALVSDLTMVVPEEKTVLDVEPVAEVITEVPSAAPTQQPSEAPTQQPTEKPSATTVPIEKQKISPGDSGERVVALQKKLIALGYLAGSADGEYGKNTQAAVKAYQKAAGLEQTGVCDYETYESMISSSAPKKKSSTKNSSSSASSDASVYIAPHSGKKYHKSDNCRSLKEAVSVKKVSKSYAVSNDYGPCGICYKN